MNIDQSEIAVTFFVVEQKFIPDKTGECWDVVI